MKYNKQNSFKISNKEIKKPFKCYDISDYNSLYVYGAEFPIKDETINEPQESKKVKPFKKIEKMITKFEENGISLSKEEEELAIDILKYINYHRLVVFGRYIYKKDKSFSKVLNLYNFDAELSSLINSYIPTIENSIKRNFAYGIAEKIENDKLINDEIPSALFYTNLNVYKNKFRNGEVREMLSIFADTLISKIGKDPMVDHHLKNYGGAIPVWVLIEFLTLGNMHKLSIYVDTKYRKAWNKSIFKNSNDKWLPEWINTITTLRNMCAHNARLYGRNPVYNPKIVDDERELIIKTLDNNVDIDEYFDKLKHTIFSGLIIMKYFYKNLPSVETKRWNLFVSTLDNLIENYDVDIKFLGFTENWKDILLI